jgi:hypothetical protein
MIEKTFINIIYSLNGDLKDLPIHARWGHYPPHNHLKCGLRFRPKEFPITPNGTQIKDKLIFELKFSSFYFPFSKLFILNFRIECPQIFVLNLTHYSC